MIGGNITAYLQISTTTKNEIGESIKTFENIWHQKGLLDLSSGDSRYATYNAKVQESTHIFICDYIQNNKIPDNAKPENTRMLIDGKTYDVKLIDDPMNLHKHIEFYLSFTGG